MCSMHPSSSPTSSATMASRCHMIPLLRKSPPECHGESSRCRIRRPSGANNLWPAVILIILLLGSAMVPVTTAKCCISIESQSDSNAPQSFSVKVSGRASTFFANNKKYDIQAVFPTNYALQPPKPVLPLTKPNCTQYVSPPNNNPNGFRCAYETNNPSYMTTFMIEWKVIVPPPINPETPQPKPEFLELWVNGDMKCEQETLVDNCPDPATGKPTNATSGTLRGRNVALPGMIDGVNRGRWVGFLALGLAVCAGSLIV